MSIKPAGVIFITKITKKWRSYPVRYGLVIAAVFTDRAKPPAAPGQWE